MIRRLAPALVLGALLMGCAGPAPQEATTDPSRLTLSQTHVHAVDRPAPGGPVLLATHHGLWIQENGELSRVGPVMDLMGFVAVDGSTFRASGHPPAGTDLPDPMGLIESTDGGQTWTPLSRVGLSDFHLLESNAEFTVGFDGLFRWSTDGVQWHTTPAPEALLDLALNPTSETLLVTTATEVLATDDHGRTWTPMPGAPDLVRVDWADEERLVGLDHGGGVHVSRDGGHTWEEGPRVSDAPVQAMAAGTTVDGQLEILVVGDTEVVSHQW